MQDQQQTSHSLSEQQIERTILMEAVAQSDAGLAFLQWLCQLCGWSRSTASDIESARRDIWIAVRRYIPVEALVRIEYEDLKREQQLTRELLNTEMFSPPESTETL